MITTRRTRLVGGLLTAALALTAAACGGGEPATQDDGSVAGTDATAELTYGIWDLNQVPAMEALVENFGEQYPNITVQITHTPPQQYWTKLQTQASSGTLPDVFWMNGPNVTLYAANGKIAPIAPLVEKGIVDPANYPDAMNELYTVEGTQYAVPKDFDTVAMWFNRDVFARAGVNPPTAEWTWDDFEKAGVAISQKLASEGTYGVVMDLNSSQSTYYNSVLQAGGFVISQDGEKSGYDEPATIRGLQLWRDLIESGAAPNVQQLSDTTANQWFGSGRAGMMWSGTWMVPEFAESPEAANIDVAPLPRDVERGTVIHGLGAVMAADGDNPAAARAFLGYLGSKEAALIQARMGAANPAFAGTSQEWLKSAPDFDLQVFLDAVEYAHPYPVSENAAAWNQLEAELLPQGFSGRRPMAEVATELAGGMNAILEQE